MTVPGFYDDVATLSRAERKALNALPFKAKAFRKTVGAPALCGEKGLLRRRAALVPADAGAERHLGRLHGAKAPRR